MRSGYRTWYFFVAWTLFSLFWMAQASGFRLPTLDGGLNQLPFFGLPFLLIGIGGLARPLWRRLEARSIVYAITTERAVTIEGTQTVKVRSFAGHDISSIERTEHEDGSGDLVLKTEQERDSDGVVSTSRYGFFGIESVRDVEKLVEKLVRVSHR